MGLKALIAAGVAGGAAYVLLKAVKFGGVENNERVIYVTQPAPDQDTGPSKAGKALALFDIGLGLWDTFGGKPLFGGSSGSGAVSGTSGGDNLPQVLQAAYDRVSGGGGGGSAAGSGTGPGGLDFGSYESKYRLPTGYLNRTAQIESSMNPNAQNPSSSAGGLFQFINSTAKQYGLSNKYDAVASTDAASRLAADNAKTLRGVLGREPTAAELYLAHQQGGAGAAKLLRNPSAKASTVVGSAAVRLNGGSESMTAGQFAGLWINKFNKGF